jgi:hypothetical protein
MWSDWRATCNAFPVFYGMALKGEPYRDPDGNPWPHVAAKPLLPDVTYSASTLSPGSSYGTVYFRVDGKGGVRVLDWDEVHAETQATSSAGSP